MKGDDKAADRVRKSKALEEAGAGAARRGCSGAAGRRRAGAQAAGRRSAQRRRRRCRVHRSEGRRAISGMYRNGRLNQRAHGHSVRRELVVHGCGSDGRDMAVWMHE